VFFSHLAISVKALKETLTKADPKPVDWPHPCFIHDRIPDGRGVASMPVC